MKNNQIVMKSVTKEEMAEKLGVSSRQLRYWCNGMLFAELQAMHYVKSQKYFTARQAQFILDELLNRE